MDSKVKILIIEDKSFFAEHIKTLLESFTECSIYTVSNGENTMQYVKDAQLDLTFMDIVLEGKFDAIETAEIIRKNRLLLQHNSCINQSLEKKYHPLVITDEYTTVTSINDAASRLFCIEEKSILSKAYESQSILNIANTDSFEHIPCQLVC
ncbi:response regulator [Candidatus Sulfurimonas marisnigri]|uniref:Response regulator n=1 Tax=Candidatus Sulfurimonas marisnigri TaxID=2740405 RepID=A0A7S7M176_9BACT|nr:response regulator [Candidatus Sulfurimonas marisnigri]QOY55251.1 response regulator [Candidatus Sulfurimonas marisnigri]